MDVAPERSQGNAAPSQRRLDDDGVDREDGTGRVVRGHRLLFEGRAARAADEARAVVAFNRHDAEEVAGLALPVRQGLARRGLVGRVARRFQRVERVDVFPQRRPEAHFYGRQRCHLAREQCGDGLAHAGQAVRVVCPAVPTPQFRRPAQSCVRPATAVVFLRPLIGNARLRTRSCGWREIGEQSSSEPCTSVATRRRAAL